MSLILASPSSAAILDRPFFAYTACVQKHTSSWAAGPNSRFRVRFFGGSRYLLYDHSDCECRQGRRLRRPGRSIGFRRYTARWHMNEKENHSKHAGIHKDQIADWVGSLWQTGRQAWIVVFVVLGTMLDYGGGWNDRCLAWHKTAGCK